MGRSLSKGVSVHGGEVCVQRGCLSMGGSLSGKPPTAKSGRYASYWNAFLFFLCFFLENANDKYKYHRLLLQNYRRVNKAQ